jgi:uncharacterized protein (TIGR04255 family)
MNGAAGGSTPLSSSSSREGLPSFRFPPVVEVAVGVEFLQLPGLGPVKLVGLYELWGDRFPKIREQPALPPAPPVRAPRGFQFQVTLGLAMRLWMLNESEDELLQVQNDRLLLNWRRRRGVGDDRTYPRYDYLREVYQGIYADFHSQVVRSNVGTFRPHTAVVSYVNRFELAPGEGLADAIAPLSQTWNLLSDATPEIRVKVPVKSGDDPDALSGVLTAKASIDSKDRKYGYLEVVTRIGLSDPDGDVFACLDLAHWSCVDGFDRFTTEKMHERWGKE